MAKKKRKYVRRAKPDDSHLMQHAQEVPVVSVGEQLAREYPRSMKIAEKLNRAYDKGREEMMHHYANRPQAATTKPLNDQRLEAMIRLVSVVGQAMDVQSKLLSGLGQTLDTFR